MKKTIKSKSELDFRGLSNEELLIIFSSINDYYETLNDNLKQGVVHKTVATSHGPEIEVINIQPEDIESITSSDYYMTIRSIVNKLEPIVEIINEVQPSLSKKLKI